MLLAMFPWAFSFSNEMPLQEQNVAWKHVKLHCTSCIKPFSHCFSYPRGIQPRGNTTTGEYNHGRIQPRENTTPGRPQEFFTPRLPRRSFTLSPPAYMYFLGPYSPGLRTHVSRYDQTPGQPLWSRRFEQYRPTLLVFRSRVYCSKRWDHNGSFQSQHISHGCTRKFTSNSYFLLSTPCKASNITYYHVYSESQYSVFSTQYCARMTSIQKPLYFGRYIIWESTFMKFWSEQNNILNEICIQISLAGSEKYLTTCHSKILNMQSLKSAWPSSWN